MSFFIIKLLFVQVFITLNYNKANFLLALSYFFFHTATKLYMVLQIVFIAFTCIIDITISNLLNLTVIHWCYPILVSLVLLLSNSNNNELTHQ